MQRSFPTLILAVFSLSDGNMTDASVLTVRNLYKTYSSGLDALRDVNLDIQGGEIFALLGPNGAGKTTLISTICGIVSPTSGSITIGGHDHQMAYRQARKLIGLVPQELHTEAFESVLQTVTYSRGLFGLAPSASYIEKVLRDLTLWDKRNEQIRHLSGGMKRRVMIAKALAHEPRILFLDEPTAGVDVELRRNLWDQVHQLRRDGVTVVLTTHYIEEAQEMADRVGVINQGQIILVEEKRALMQSLGKRILRLHLENELAEIPSELDNWALTLDANGRELVFQFDAAQGKQRIPDLLNRIHMLGITYTDLNTSESSLEDIFVELVTAPNDKENA